MHTAKMLSNVNYAPFRLVTPHFIYVNGRNFFYTQHKHPNMFSAFLQWQTHCGEYLLGISARPCTTPTSHPHLSNVTAVSQRLWCSTVEECTQMHHKQCKTDTLINKVNSVQEEFTVKMILSRDNRWWMWADHVYSGHAVERWISCKLLISLCTLTDS